ncbi:hypothetical protein L6164_020067 [Bauhinia variegata]|uniref:Uncharacterized protein n=1 Tax=Bauhinia variegata TaxID=167791 RepID=A0ACB9MUP7_BAUVA|nr:hypothetical protein L6164_020067 [Bauhinia variegata]
MESVAHSRQPNKVSATLSKKISNGNNGGLPAKSLYDDVYGGPPKFAVTSLSPRFEDYGEIFGSFHTVRASSIPVLDLPVVDETEVLFDVRGSGFDYAEVFGGINRLDFAVSFEDLFHQPNGREGASSDEAWTPAETDSLSEVSDHSGNNQFQSTSNGDHYQSVDGDTEFNISYHNVNGTSNEDMLRRKTHTTQLHAVPGFTLVFDETPPLHMTDPSLEVTDDVDLDIDFNADKVKGKHLRKTLSHPPNCSSAGEQTFGGNDKPKKAFGRNASHSSEMFVTVSDISLRTHPSSVPPPSRPPPILDTNKGDNDGFHLDNEHVASQGSLSGNSPPFFDVEVDMNSSAAASAAAMKEAMHKAEAKLRVAKELKEKKEGLESCVKSDAKIKEGKESENISRSNTLKDEKMQGTCDRRSSKNKTSLPDERPKATKAAPRTPASLEREVFLNMSGNTADECHIRESRSSQGSDRSTEVGTWKEANEFFELVGTEKSGRVLQPTNQTKVSVQDTRIHERSRKEREAYNLPEEENKKVKGIEEYCQKEEDKKKSKTRKEAYEQDKIIRRSKASNEERRQREHVKKEKVAEISEQEENERNIRMAYQQRKTEKKITDADQSGNLENFFEAQHKEYTQTASEKSKDNDRLSEVQQGVKFKETEKKLKEAEKQSESVKKQKQSEKMRDEKRQREASALGQPVDEERLKESKELDTNNATSEQAFEQGKAEGTETCRTDDKKRLKVDQVLNEKGLKEAFEREETNKTLNNVFQKEESDDGLKQAQQGRNDLKVNDKYLKEALGQKSVKEAYERDQGKEMLRDALDGYGHENRHQEVDQGKRTWKVLDQASDGGIIEESVSTSNLEFDQKGSDNLSNEDGHQEQSEKVLNDAGGKEKDQGLDRGLELNEDGKKLKFDKETDGEFSQSASTHEENIGKLEESQESFADQEIRNVRTKCRNQEKKLEEVGMKSVLANKKIRAHEVAQGDMEHAGVPAGKVGDTMTEADELGFGSEETCIEKTGTVSGNEFDLRSQEKKFAHEWGERGKNNQHVKVVMNQEEGSNMYGDSGRNKAAESATVPETANAQKTAQRFHVGRPIERKERNLNESLASEEKDAERMRRERELEKEHLRKIEEEREREREREKDRMAVDKAMLEAEREREREKDRIAVDRATLEARERTYAEARERAERAAFERATAEARQRALAEARERLEKACAEARDKSFVDKTAAEARLKAERAAVERATAEARERAMEKAKVERNAFESRERLERSVSDKFGGPFRNAGGRQGFSSSDMQDPQFHNGTASTGSRYPYSSVYGASSFSERSEGGEGESAQRCRARLERYRRTAERAAKALAEKNMRDLQAQKEQAERNRLAETLDAEVRRWSSGKEGNLRALLSTLQYILGPDSGWLPIPLTEVITSAAVKKAYRKATLCVHPDKLQQRGASIQHKYICEKVFDLLKEAWNKFNSEER